MDFTQQIFDLPGKSLRFETLCWPSRLQSEFTEVMKRCRRLLIALVLINVALFGIGWFHLNKNAIVGNTEDEAIREIVSKYHDIENAEGITMKFSSSEGRPGEGRQKTYRVSYLSKEIATVRIKPFLGLGWQEVGYTNSL